MSNFIQNCVRGLAVYDEIDDYIDEWHEGDSQQELHEFLGMTPQDYSLWLKEPDALPHIITAHRENEDSQKYFSRCSQQDRLSLAARSTNPEGVHELARWLREEENAD